MRHEVSCVPASKLFLELLVLNEHGIHVLARKDVAGLSLCSEIGRDFARELQILVLGQHALVLERLGGA